MPVLFAHDIISFIRAKWEKLIRQVENGHITPDNNRVENDIRTLAAGRGNRLFAGHPSGANAAATLYSLTAAARAARFHLYQYFRFHFSEIPHAKTEQDYRAMMYGNLTLEILSRLMAVT